MQDKRLEKCKINLVEGNSQFTLVQILARAIFDASYAINFEQPLEGKDLGKEEENE